MALIIACAGDVVVALHHRHSAILAGVGKRSRAGWGGEQKGGGNAIAIAFRARYSTRSAPAPHPPYLPLATVLPRPIGVW
ncbi:MAG: hypothetical protein SW833_03480 [Cyanobacteriota bacterium]|nr:hypothetical protein [Cyanobacteriota bacterium]